MGRSSAAVLSLPGRTLGFPAQQMKINEGTADRAIRIIVGLVLVALVFVGPRTPWGWLGLLPLVTGIAGRCPAYTLFGIRTCRVSGKS